MRDLDYVLAVEFNPTMQLKTYKSFLDELVIFYYTKLHKVYLINFVTIRILYPIGLILVHNCILIPQPFCLRDYVKPASTHVNQCPTRLHCNDTVPIISGLGGPSVSDKLSL